MFILIVEKLENKHFRKKKCLCQFYHAKVSFISRFFSMVFHMVVITLCIYKCYIYVMYLALA